MITRIFALDENKNTQDKAWHLAQFLNKSRGDIDLRLFTKNKKTSLQDLNQTDLNKLFFLGSSVGKRFGDFTAQEFAADLATAVWPPVDRMLVYDLYFIDTDGRFTEADIFLMQELTDELARRYFSRLTLHVVTYDQILKDKAGSMLESAVYTYKPKESLAARSKRINACGESTASWNMSFLSGLSKRTACDIPLVLKQRTEELVNLLETEIKQLQDKRTRTYFFLWFINYELTTKIKKQNCVKDLLKAQTLEQLQEKAKNWSEDTRILRHWKNTCTQTWWQSRTQDLLEAILKNPTEKSLSLKR